MTTRVLASIVGAAFLVACGLGASRATPLADTHASAEALASAVLDALARRDLDMLRRLALDEQEFRDHVWPALPAARPERNLPFSYVWGDLRQKSAASLAATLARQGGVQYELVGVRFEGETNYGSYRVHRQATFDVRDATGARQSLRLIGSMFDRDGDWKVFSYVTSD